MVITGNSAGGDNGGGIYAEMQFSALSFTINNTLISDNQAANGGGISIGLNGPIELTNSTLSGNTADGGGSPGAEGSGGAIYLDAVNSNGAVFRASNCTLSGNNADFGAAIAADPSVQKASAMTNCTIAFNGDGAGNGIEMPGTQLEKVFPGNTNNPFAKNLLVGNAPQNCTGLFDHLNDTNNSGSNLASDMSCGFTQGTDSEVAGAGAVMIDANLADNGGATPTHRLLVGSPAIDLGNAIGTTGDQRGAPAADGTNDMTDAVVRDSGAYEFAGFSAVEFADPSLSVDEDDTPLQFVLRRYGDVSQALSGVSISTEEGTADATDYDATPMPATIDFAAGVTTSAQIDVGIVDDTTDELDGLRASVALELRSPSSAKTLRLCGRSIAQPALARPGSHHAQGPGQAAQLDRRGVQRALTVEAERQLAREGLDPHPGALQQVDAGRVAVLAAEDLGELGQQPRAAHVLDQAQVEQSVVEAGARAEQEPAAVAARVGHADQERAPLVAAALPADPQLGRGLAQERPQRGDHVQELAAAEA
mgnify:CR=1 FL=1